MGRQGHVGLRADAGDNTRVASSAVTAVGVIGTRLLVPMQAGLTWSPFGMTWTLSAGGWMAVELLCASCVPFAECCRSAAGAADGLRTYFPQAERLYKSVSILGL